MGAPHAFGASAEAWPASDDAPWTALHEGDGVALYTRPFPGSAFPEVRVSAHVCATLPQLVKFVEDVSAFTTWIPDTAEAQLLATPSPQEQLYYIRTSMPWPVKHRDMVYRLTESAGAPGTLSVSIQGVPDYLPPVRGVIRMTHVSGRWTFRDDAQGTLIGLDMHIEPGGNVPVWLANRRIVAMPGGMLANLRARFAASCHAAGPAGSE